MTLRNILIPFLLLAGVAAAAPATANHGGYHSGLATDAGWNRGGPSRQAINELIRDLNRVEARIARSAQRRIISQREAFSLRREANTIERSLQRAARDGISGREFARLRAQVNRLGQRVRIERQDRDGRRN